MVEVWPRWNRLPEPESGKICPFFLTGPGQAETHFYNISVKAGSILPVRSKPEAVAKRDKMFYVSIL
jgi:hypothetical protein